tara:strand:- start:4592 stop:4819 length:228 start_codon:yes stop_codon:yes gene_type:complete
MPKAELSRESIILENSEETYESLNSPKVDTSKKCNKMRFFACFICTIFMSGAIYSSYLYYEMKYNNDNSGSDEIF